MKQALSLLLAFVMCLSLTACGSGETETAQTQTNPEVIEQTLASAETEEQIVETVAETTEIVEATAPVIMDHPMLSHAYGTWIGDLGGHEPGDAETVTFIQITFNEDGTCIMDDVTGVWGTSTKYADVSNLMLDIYVGTDYLYTAELRSETYIRFIDGKTGVLLNGWFAPQE